MKVRAVLLSLVTPAVVLEAWAPAAQPLFRHVHQRMSDFDFPSDSWSAPEDAVAEDAVIVVEPDVSIASLLRLGAYTSKGEAASDEEKQFGRSLVAQLEALQEGAIDAAACEGTWELVFSDTQLFRSSPFFMAGRAVCQTPEEVARYNWFCEMHRAALAISTIKRVRQVISPNRVVSEFEVSAGAVPFIGAGYSGGLPLAITGAIVSSADVVSKEGGRLELLMDTVEIKGSNVPLLRQTLDAGVRLDSRALSERLAAAAVGGYEAPPTPVFETTFVDESLRVSRDQDGNAFVYAKTSDSIEPSDYSDVLADLGVGALVEGLLRVFS